MNKKDGVLDPMAEKPTGAEAAIKSAIAQIEKQYGRGIIFDMGKPQTPFEMETFPSGSLRLDNAMGIGGYPRGRIIEIMGLESGGKTTLALMAIAQIQKQGLRALFVDAEHALDMKYAKKLGVNPNLLMVTQPDYGEQGLDVAEAMITTGGFGLVVVDSVSALVPRVEVEGDMGEATIGVQARLMGRAMRKLVPIAGRTKTTMIFINQIRMKVGVLYGSPETTSGGNALKFFSSIRLDVRRAGGKDESVKKEGGISIRIKVIKNKLAAPFREMETIMIPGKGIPIGADVGDYAMELGILTRTGSWYNFKGERLANGKDAFCRYLEEHPELVEELVTIIRAKGLSEDVPLLDQSEYSDGGDGGGSAEDLVSPDRLEEEFNEEV